MDARPGAQAPAASPRGTSWLWDPTLDERPDPWPGERAWGTALAPGAARHGGRRRPLGGTTVPPRRGHRGAQDLVLGTTRVPSRRGGVRAQQVPSGSIRMAREPRS